VVVNSEMSLLVVGCDGSWPGPGGAGSGYVVSSGTTRILLDAGPGTFANLQRFVDPASLDAVFISHHHPDHWIDLHALSTHARRALGRSDLPVYAPATVLDRTGTDDLSVLTGCSVTGGDVVAIGDLTCSFFQTDHSFETLAIRIEAAGRTFGYSADTGPGWPVGELGSGLDLLLAEATYSVSREGTERHMSGRQAGDQARRAEARRLMITHCRPNTDSRVVLAEAAAAFGRDVEQAAIGKELLV
jgi:ribonuclease BN (tRNA processing enzyme)